MLLLVAQPEAVEVEMAGSAVALGVVVIVMLIELAAGLAAVVVL